MAFVKFKQKRFRDDSWSEDPMVVNTDNIVAVHWDKRSLSTGLGGSYVTTSISCLTVNLLETKDGSSKFITYDLVTTPEEACQIIEEALHPIGK